MCYSVVSNHKTVDDFYTHLLDLCASDVCPASVKRDAAPILNVLYEYRNNPVGCTVSDAAAVIMLSKLYFSKHDNGKIAGLVSVDSSAVTCSFCAKMQRLHILGCVCSECYAKAQCEWKRGTAERHTLNMFILAAFSYTVEQLRLYCVQDVYTLDIRINSDGDFENATHAENVLKLALSRPARQVGIWYKNYPAFNAAAEKIGIPANVETIYSDPIINGSNVPAIATKFAKHVFRVYDKAHIKTALENGDNPCNGRKCAECGFKCYNGTWKNFYIAEKLRVQKAGN